jgi:hypothetical protein
VFLNVTIINFNYDRLIEQYIYSELRTRLDVSPHDAAQTVARLKMIRPYGSVSPLPSFGGQISFGQNLPDEIDNLPRLAFGIMTFTEQNMSASYQSIYKTHLIVSACCVYWFWFHQQNLKILYAPMIESPNGQRHVIATFYM